MAIPHAKPGDVVSVRPLADKLPQRLTTTLIKTNHIEVLRLVLPQGKRIPRHQVPGEVTVQCLEGAIRVRLEDRIVELRAGDLLYFDRHQVHDLEAIDASTALVTILLVREHKEPVHDWPSVLAAELQELAPLSN